MSSFIKTMAALSFSLFLFGCAGTPGASSVSALNQTNVLIDGSKNFRYVHRGVVGIGKCVYVFGIGGLATPNGIIGEARRNLLRNYELQPNQAMVNVTYDRHSSTVLGIVYTVKYIITADIIEFY
jgi:hypothetical protein